MKIELTPIQTQQVFATLKDLLDVNGQPFVGQAKRLLYELQTEIKYFQEAKPEDIEAIKDQSRQFGEKIAPPTHFPAEYAETLELVCKDVPEKRSKFAEITENGQVEVENE